MYLIKFMRIFLFNLLSNTKTIHCKFANFGFKQYAALSTLSCRG